MLSVCLGSEEKEEERETTSPTKRSVWLRVYPPVDLFFIYLSLFLLSYHLLFASPVSSDLVFFSKSTVTEAKKENLSKYLIITPLHTDSRLIHDMTSRDKRKRRKKEEEEKEKKKKKFS